MILPKGEAVHKNLSTAYTDLVALLEALKLEDFCGTVELDFLETKGVLFIDSGEIINGQVQGRGETEVLTGKEAVKTLLTLSKRKDGVLNLHQLPAEKVALVANHLHQPLLFKELSTQFIRFDEFLQKMKEERHTGYIEVLTRDRQPMGVVFLEEGELIEMFITPKTGPSIFGSITLPAFIENATTLGALFNVYGVPGTSGKAEESARVTSEEGTPNRNEGDGTGSQGERERLQDLLHLFQNFLSDAEKVVDSLTPKGTFKKLFKKARIDQAETFGFLDPFAGEFEYENGTIRFLGEVTREEFTKGLIEAFRSAMARLEKEVPKEKMVSLKLKAGIESFIVAHRDALVRLNLEEPLSSLLP
ncbi:MAG: hypothetical protein N3G78_07415 [Desulfobacterota bacterium]|nr:hypothetical protein [Thermodesulfobacteriota bacterium]